MPTLRHSDRDLNEYEDEQEQDREISLGMGTILAIFFGLVLVCALFFGFGYSMGRKSSGPAVAAVQDAPPVSAGGAKPAPGSPLKAVEGFFGKKEAPAPAPDADAASDAGVSGSAPADGENQAEVVNQLKQATQGDAAATSGAKPRASSGAVNAAAAAPVRAGKVAAGGGPAVAAGLPAVSPNGTTMVQVAAVSHQEDADLLVAALKKRGYAVIVRQEAQDHLLHVQVGPFANKKDAEAMRQKLLTDGYNAIVK